MITEVLSHYGVARRDDMPPLAWTLLWPLLLARAIWTSAVADDAAIRFNLRLLAALTALFSLPDIAQGGWTVLRHPSGGDHYYGAYVLLLGCMELAGGLLLGRALLSRRASIATGRALILAAAAGFYVEAALGLGVFERGVVAAAIFAVCLPADAWVLWFLLHPRTRVHLTTRGASSRLR